MNDVVVTAKPTEIEIPLSLKAASELVAKHKGKGADEVFDKMVEVAGEIGKAAEKVKSTCERVLANQMATSIKNASDAKAAANKIFSAIAGKLDTTRQRTEAFIEQLEQSTQPPRPKDTAAMLYAGEVRVALLRMTATERAKAIKQAIDDGDDDFVSAAISANAALTGLGKAEAAAMTDAWKRKRHADTLTRIEHLKGGLQEFNRLSSLLLGFAVGILTDKNAAIAAAERSAQLAKEAIEAAVA